MTDNGSHGYSEGSEPIKLTEGIEKEAEVWANSKEGLEWYDAGEMGLIQSYIAGATEWYRRGHDKAMEEMKARDENAVEQLNQERNRAIDECLAVLVNYTGAFTRIEYIRELKRELESLKSDSK